jgi:hypothetical protein
VCAGTTVGGISKGSKEAIFTHTIPRRPENQKAHLQHSRGLAAIKTIVNESILNESILERRRKVAATWDLRGAQTKGTLVAQER